MTQLPAPKPAVSADKVHRPAEQHIYEEAKIRENARWDVKDEREDIEKDEKKQKDRRNAVVTSALYLALLYILYLAAHQFANFSLF
jgi:hypothetical protein